jgi:hypothetical protein
MSYNINGTTIVDYGTGSRLTSNCLGINPISSGQSASISIGTKNAQVTGTSGEGAYHYGSGTSFGYISACKNGYSVYSLAKTSGYSSGLMCLFSASGSPVGSIAFDGTEIDYNTTSDYRLKQNIVPMYSQLQSIKSLRPVTYTINNGSDTTTFNTGFIAHEVEDVYPELVSGTKDAVDENGQPEYQNLDYRGFTPHLTKALQEAMEMIEDLEDKIEQADARIKILELLSQWKKRWWWFFKR